MHPSAMSYAVEALRTVIAQTRAEVLVEIGARDVNGSVRAVADWPIDKWITTDIAEGPGVDVVADGTFLPFRSNYADIVLTCETLEHTPVWATICWEANRVLRPGGYLVLTTACPGRAPHSGTDGGEVRGGEYYGNVDPGQLLNALRNTGFEGINISVLGDESDVRATAKKPLDK